MVQICVDDIVFESMSQRRVEQFVVHMSTGFEISLVSELTYFLGPQVRQTSSDTFVSLVKYAKNLGMKFKIDTTKHRRTHIGTHAKITRDEASNGDGHTLYSVGVCARY